MYFVFYGVFIGQVLMRTFSNQWVSYDDEKTFEIKMNYANERCLGGTMIWSVDQDDSFDYSARAFHFSSSALSSPLGLHILTQIHSEGALSHGSRC